jgi:hypothetical protein
MNKIPLTRLLCSTVRDLWKLLFGRFEYGVGDTPPKGVNFSDLESADVKKAKILIRIVSRFNPNSK